MDEAHDKGAVLVTGGAGFFGGLLKTRLLEEGYRCVSVDLQKDDAVHASLTAVQGDVRDVALMDRLLAEGDIGVIFHCAAILAHVTKDERSLWSSNVEGTKVVAEAARRHGVRKIVFTSSNCLWGRDLGRPVREDDAPEPVEIYGRSKQEGERILAATPGVDAVIIRCPTIIDAGRLGLLSILFEFIDEGRKVWTVGDGGNRYQFVYAADLIDACLRAMHYEGGDTFNVGSDHVATLKQVYEYVIEKAGTRARTASIPRGLIVPAMRAAHALGLSPLGPYHYRMISENFIFDTSKIKTKLGWRPTLTNEEMLWKAYAHFHEHRAEIASRGEGVSAHRRPAAMGAIRLLKWLS